MNTGKPEQFLITCKNRVTYERFSYEINEPLLHPGIKTRYLQNKRRKQNQSPPTRLTQTPRGVHYPNVRSHRTLITPKPRPDTTSPIQHGLKVPSTSLIPTNKKRREEKIHRTYRKAFPGESDPLPLEDIRNATEKTRENREKERKKTRDRKVKRWQKKYKHKEMLDLKSYTTTQGYPWTAPSTE